ncbi:MAG: LPS-assembly protein LptD [Tannerellaceae bacterium]|nr:LPS-assembly protein LptD [Tannerellaceae bacterium]
MQAQTDVSSAGRAALDGQEGRLPDIAPPDSVTVSPDAIPPDTIPPSKNVLEAPVTYHSTDSMIITADNKAYLYGEGHVAYQQLELDAEKIEMSMDSSLVYATFGLDSIGSEFGYPLFKEGEQQYESKSMRYNFKTKKGYITNVITQQGEGYVTSARTKKMENDILNMANGKYTTCDDHDHPHFYIQMTRAKVRPNKNIVTGPVYLVIEDVPLYPIGLPFAFFPFSDKYSSGILFPSFGDDSRLGFWLRDFGYYFALSDYMDLALTGNIYTKGSWGFQARSGYRKRYKFSGNFFTEYIVTKDGDKGLPDYSLSKDFKVTWTHTQDPKANPFRTFSASVNYSTSSYDRNNTPGYTRPSSTENSKNSSVSVSQRFPNSPFNISATMNVNQVSRTGSLNVTLPDVNISMTRIYPLKRKRAIGKDRWYEKISLSYTGALSNRINTYDSLFFKSNILKDWDNGMKHSIPVSATFNVLKYINITPSFNYSERWSTKQVKQEYDIQQNRMMPSDTTYGFYRNYDYSASVGASTTVYGYFQPLPFLGGFVKMIRHKLDISTSVSYSPDFGDPKYGFYKRYQYYDQNGVNQTMTYSPFTSGAYGPPSAGKSGNVSISFANNIEAKVRSNRDSIGEKKITLIDNLSIGTGYNMMADSLNWSDISLSLRLKLSKSYSVNLSGSLEPYVFNFDRAGGAVYRSNNLRIRNGKGFGRLRGTSTSFSYTFNNETFKKLFGGKEEKGGEGENAHDHDHEGENEDALDTYNRDRDLVSSENALGGGGRLRGQKKEVGDADADGYWVNSFPWSLSFNYSLTLGWDMSKFNYEKKEYPYKLTHALSFSGNAQPTKNWQFNFNATYDFDSKKITYLTCNLSRNLHCFTMTASFVPVGYYKSYFFSVAVSSSLLKDLKYDRRSNSRDVSQWY